MTSRRKQVDYALFTATIFLVIFGFVMLASASSDLGKSRFDDAYYYIKHQFMIGFLPGAAGFLIGFFLPYKHYRKFAPFLLLTNIILLFLVFTPLGFSAGGASRWIQVGPVTFQPMELLKLSFVMYLAAWLSNAKANRGANVFEGLMPFMAISGVIGLLLLLQHSTSSVMVLMPTALAIYFTAGARKRYIAAVVGIGLVFIAIIIMITPYRMQRIMTFMDPAADAQGAGYQINQSLITIGSGGMWGVGYGSSFSKRYLPERIGDFIFAVAAEEFGFIGSLVLIGTFFLVFTRGYLLARKIGDKFGKYLLVGFSTVIAVQAFIHIGANSGLIPLTGVPLPFISYGGTALAVFMTMGGIMLNISKNA